VIALTAAALLVLAAVFVALRRLLDSLVARLGLRRLYGVGDRVAVGDVEGEVIAVGPLRTKVREDAGGVVSFANRTVLETPVRTFSPDVRQELRLGIPYRADWEHAERILLEEGGEGSTVAVGLTDDWVELVLRFTGPTRDEVSRAILLRLTDAGIPVASRTVEVKVGDPLDAARPSNVP
jgi:small-conductance mechanosensitive channel